MLRFKNEIYFDSQFILLRDTRGIKAAPAYTGKGACITTLPFGMFWIGSHTSRLF